MKAEVIRAYIDKHTMQPVDKGSIITVSKERYEEINSASPKHTYLQEVPEKKKKPTTKKKK